MASGDDSLFAPYLKTLPEETPPSLITWTKEQCIALQGTSLERNVDGDLFEKAFKEKLLPLMQQHPELWPSSVRSLEKARSAASLVQSRVFHMKEENWVTNIVSQVHEGTTLYLIPGIDMINHSCSQKKVNTELTKCKETITVELEKGEQRTIDGYFAMKAERDIPAGDEILHSYGDLSDAALLRIYGFVSEDSNPHDFLVLPYTTIRMACEAVIAKQQWNATDLDGREAFLSRHLHHDIDDIKEVEFHLSVDALLTDKLLTIVQVLMLPDDELQELMNEHDKDDSVRSEEDTFVLGIEYVDNSDWSEIVVLAFIEVANVLEKNLNRNPHAAMPFDGNRSSCEGMIFAVVRGEQHILNAFKKDALSLMPYDSDSSDEGSSNGINPKPETPVNEAFVHSKTDDVHPRKKTKPN